MHLKSFLLVALSCVYGEENALVKPDPSTLLTHKTFKNALESNSVVFVKFYTKWCHMCKSMFKPWKHLGRHYFNDSRVLIGEMDCEFEDNDDICDSYNVELYPTFILFSDGKEIDDFVGMETKKHFIRYVEKIFKKPKLVKDET